MIEPSEAKVKVLETFDRYLVVDSESGENMDGDEIGFEHRVTAEHWAETQGWEVEPE